MKSKLISLFTLLLSLMVMAACGGGSSDAPPAQAPADSGQAAAPAESGESGEPVTITMWTKEGEGDGSLQFVNSVADEFMAANPNVKVEVVKKGNVEELREDFQTSALAGSSPDLLWTVNDHAGPFTVAGLIQPVDDLFEMDKYVPAAVEAVKLDGETWGVPVSSGNHLMLYYNKDLIAEPPANTDELIAKGKELSGDVTPLVFNQTEAFWLVPWLGGFGGQVFAEDGVTPTLDTPEMVDTLNFLHEIKFTDQIIPLESDYDTADTLFKESKAAMIINGDWVLAPYVEALGDKLGVARIPEVSATGEWPKPFTSGNYFMIPAAVEGAKLEAIKAFIDHATSKETQLQQVADIKRLPGLQEALDDPSISEDPQLAGVIDQLQVGTGMPAVLEMRCNWDAMKPEMQAVLADRKSAEDAAKAMQDAAVNCIKTLE
ncbi:MAG: extracellular solute-binding protein [Anaerolineae bacterium]|nr:extracellular solute-binding protein [Anaerolineae bacterium]